MSTQTPRPTHGGNAHVLKTDQPITLDLSSAVSPFAYPNVHDLTAAWTQLPYPDDALQSAMNDYFGCVNFRVVPGTQWAIEYLPRKLHSLIKGDLPTGTRHSQQTLSVALPLIGYAEHAYHWSKLGDVKCVFYEGTPTPEIIKQVDVCVLINPNNPLGLVNSKATIQTLMKAAYRQSTWLVIDETFVDYIDGVSVSRSLSQESAKRTIILRSFGKFSGLPGARLGAIGVHQSLLASIEEDTPLWGVSGPSIAIYKRVLCDHAWIRSTQKRVQLHAKRLKQLLAGYFNAVSADALLFCTVFFEHAQGAYLGLLQQGVYVRLLDDQSGLRFSLPSDEQAFKVLDSALREVMAGYLGS